MRSLVTLLSISVAAAYHFSAPPLLGYGINSQITVNADDDASTIQPANNGIQQPNNVAQNTPSLLPRRSILSNLLLAPALYLTSSSANAQEATESSLSMLEKRLFENTLSPPSYNMESADIFYPSYFIGSWKSSSKTTNIYSPCGFELFPGGQAAYDAAYQKEVIGNDILEYRARFIASDADVVVADREYNAKEIAKAAMGSFSVVDVKEATPNRFSCLLAPVEGSGGSLICVDILAIARKYESISPTQFICSEVVRQIVSPANSKSNPNAPPTSPLSVKEIETISLYSIADNTIDAVKEIKCKQRTAMFLVPSQTDPVAFKKWQMSRGQPVDIRYYDVTYSRI